MRDKGEGVSLLEDVIVLGISILFVLLVLAISVLIWFPGLLLAAGRVPW